MQRLDSAFFEGPFASWSKNDDRESLTGRQASAYSLLEEIPIDSKAVGAIGTPGPIKVSDFAKLERFTRQKQVLQKSYKEKSEKLAEMGTNKYKRALFGNKLRKVVLKVLIVAAPIVSLACCVIPFVVTVPAIAYIGLVFLGLFGVAGVVGSVFLLYFSWSYLTSPLEDTLPFEETEVGLSKQCERLKDRIALYDLAINYFRGKILVHGNEGYLKKGLADLAKRRNKAIENNCDDERQQSAAAASGFYFLCDAYPAFVEWDTDELYVPVEE